MIISLKLVRSGTMNEVFFIADSHILTKTLRILTAVKTPGGAKIA
jgi:hypothetical protein